MNAFTSPHRRPAKYKRTGVCAHRCCAASIAILLASASVCGCKPDDDANIPLTPDANPTTPPKAVLQAQLAAELHSVIENAWSELMNGDPSEFTGLLNAELINARIIKNIEADSRWLESLEDEMNKRFSNFSDRLIRNLGGWRGGYSTIKAPIATESEFDVEIEQYHDDRGLNFMHLICTWTPEGWAIVDLYSENDGVLYTITAARFANQAMAGQVDGNDVHRLKRLGDFMHNQDYESFRRAYSGLPESLKLERGYLLMALHAAGMLEMPEWADEIRKRYVDTFGHDATMILFELNYYSGREDWEELADVCAQLNESKNGSAPVLYLKAIAELSDGKPQECVASALEGIKIDPQFDGNWFQAIGGYCELKQYEKATELVSGTLERFPDLQIDWSAEVFPGLAESNAYQKRFATQDDASPPSE